MRSYWKAEGDNLARTNDGVLGLGRLCPDGYLLDGGDGRRGAMGEVVVGTKGIWVSLSRAGIGFGDSEKTLRPWGDQ